MKGFKSLIKFLYVFFKYIFIKSILFTFYVTATDGGICCGMAVGFVGMLCWMIVLGKLGKLGCGSLRDINSIPQIVAGAYFSVLIGFSCVLD